MAIDPRIALQVQPLQLPDFNALAQQRLANTQSIMAFTQQQQQQRDQNAMRALYSGATDPNTGAINYKKLTSGLAQMGRGDLIPDIQAHQADLEAKQAAAQKAQLEIAHTKLTDLVTSIARVNNAQQGISLAQKYIQEGSLDPQKGEAIIAQINAHPEAWKGKQRDLLMSTLDAKDQVSQQLEGDRFKYQQKHDTDVLNVEKRGQDIGAATTRRGQDISAATAAADRRQRASDNAADRNLKAQLEGPNGKPLTEAQSNAVLYAARMKNADRILAGLEKGGTRSTGHIKNAVGDVLGIVPLGVGDKLHDMSDSAFNVFPTALGGPNSNQQSLDQAQRDFINATLRRESGASISPSEFASARRQYFPQAGDTKEVAQQKQRNRAIAIAGIRNAAGPGASQVDSIANTGSGGVDKSNPLLK